MIQQIEIQEGPMCPICIANTAIMVAGADSAGGIFAVCIWKFRKVFCSHEKKGEMR
jgi:hypothetical protein